MTDPVAVWRQRRNPDDLNLLDAAASGAWRHRRGLFRWPQGAAQWSRAQCRLVLAAAVIGLLLVLFATAHLFV